MRLIIDANTFYMVHVRRGQGLARHIYFCDIHLGPCTEVKHVCITASVHGSATCSKIDQFCKATGRKIAFTRAVSKLPLSTRTALWREYLKLFPPDSTSRMKHSRTHRGGESEVKHVGGVPGDTNTKPTNLHKSVLAVPSGVGSTTAPTKDRPPNPQAA